MRKNASFVSNARTHYIRRTNELQSTTTMFLLTLCSTSIPSSIPLHFSLSLAHSLLLAKHTLFDCILANIEYIFLFLCVCLALLFQRFRSELRQAQTAGDVFVFSLFCCCCKQHSSVPQELRANLLGRERKRGPWKRRLYASSSD